MSFGIVAFSSMGTLTLVRPLCKLRLLCYQFCLMLAARNHGLPNSRGYAPRDSRDSTTAEISNKWPPMTMDSFRSNPISLTERVSAMRSQKGQFSQDVMPRVVHVALLMTFTPDPSSIAHPCISVPCTRTLMTRLRWSIIVGPIIFPVVILITTVIVISAVVVPAAIVIPSVEIVIAAVVLSPPVVVIATVGIIAPVVFVAVVVLLPITVVIFVSVVGTGSLKLSGSLSWAVFAVCVVCGSICLTVVALRLSKLYSQSSSVCAREWQIGQCIQSVHSNAECPRLRQLVHCIACLNRVSSVVGRVS